MLWEHTTCIKFRDSFQRVLFFFFFFQLCSLVNLGGYGQTWNRQQRWQQAEGGSRVFPLASLGCLCAFTGWAERMCVRERMCQSVCETFVKRYKTTVSWKCLDLPKLALLFLSTVLRVNTVHPCHCCGGSPDACVPSLSKQNISICFFSNLNNVSYSMKWRVACHAFRFFCSFCWQCMSLKACVIKITTEVTFGEQHWRCTALGIAFLVLIPGCCF